MSVGTWLVVGLTAASVRASGENVAVAPLALSAKVEKARPRIESSVEAGLRAAGLEVLTMPREARGSFSRCSTSMCPSDVLRAVGTSYVVRGSVETPKRGFTLVLATIRVADGAEVMTETVTCAPDDPCPPVPDTAREAAQELGRKTRQFLADQRLANRPPAPAPDRALPGPAAPVPVGPVAVVPPLTTTTKPASNSSGAVWHWVVAGVAVPALAAGIYLVGIDGNTFDCHDGAGRSVCLQKRTTKWQGMTLIGVGITGGALVGGYYIFRSSQPTGTSVSLGLDGISVSGRF